jgi:hypothetical protein
MDVTSGAKLPWKDRKFVHDNYPTILPLSKAQLKILKKFAYMAPTNANRLSKETKKAYSFVHDTLIALEQRKIISSIDVKSVKHTPERIYDLELEGIFWLIRDDIFARKNDKVAYNLIITLLKHYRSKLPLVFDKWSYFRDAGFEDLFFNRLWFLAELHKKDRVYKDTIEMQRQLTKFFYLFDFYNLTSPIFKFDVKAWFTAWRNDSEIRDFVIKELKNDAQLLKIHLTNAEDVVIFLESNPKK